MPFVTLQYNFQMPFWFSKILFCLKVTKRDDSENPFLKLPCKEKNTIKWDTFIELRWVVEPRRPFLTTSLNDHKRSG